MKYVNTNPVHAMSGPPTAPPPPATVTRSPVVSRDIAARVGIVSRDQRHAMSGGLPHDNFEAGPLAAAAAADLVAHPVKGEAPAPTAQKRGTLPVAYPDAPNSVTGTLPNSSVPVSTLEKDAADALRARGVSQP